MQKGKCIFSTKKLGTANNLKYALFCHITNDDSHIAFLVKTTKIHQCMRNFQLLKMKCQISLNIFVVFPRVACLVDKLF